MFIKIRDYTINVDAIQYIYHYDEGVLGVYFGKDHKISLDRPASERFLEKLEKLHEELAR